MRLKMARVITYIVLGAVETKAFARLITVFAKFLFVVLSRTSLTALLSLLRSLNAMFSCLRSAEGSSAGVSPAIGRREAGETLMR